MYLCHILSESIYASHEQHDNQLYFFSESRVFRICRSHTWHCRKLGLCFDLLSLLLTKLVFLVITVMWKLTFNM